MLTGKFAKTGQANTFHQRKIKQLPSTQKLSAISYACILFKEHRNADEIELMPCLEGEYVVSASLQYVLIRTFAP